MKKPLLIACLAWLLSACGADTPDTTGASNERFRWKLVTAWPRDYPGLGTGVQRFVDDVETMSGGRLKIQVYGDKELVPASGVFDAVSLGTAEMGHSAAYYWKGKLPAAQFFTAVPFGMTAQEFNGWLHHGDGMALWTELYAPFNVIPLAAGNTGTQMAGWFNREIRSLADLRGLKVRLPGLGGEVLSRAGVTIVNMPGSDIFTSMQTGVIDAVEWVGPYNDMAFGLHRVARYYYYPGWQEPGPGVELLLNRQAFARLPADLQQIVRVAARALNQDMLDEYNARNARALQELVDHHGVQLRRLPADVIDRLRHLSAQVMAELAATDPMAARVQASYNAYLEQVRTTTAIGEQALLEIR